MSGLGLYVHYPFCKAKCPYCDFASVGSQSGQAGLAAGYFETIQRELALWLEAAPNLRNRVLTSVYIGGGTPSLARAEEIAAFLDAVRSVLALPSHAEVTLEANPGVADQVRFAACRRAGVNRLSLGVQSFSPRELEALGRSHTAEEARLAIKAARAAGLENLSVDLIFGVPGQTVADFLRSLEELLGFRPEHISVYGLTLYEATPFHERAACGALTLPSEDEQAEMFLGARRRLLAEGYAHYEISNYARPGFESRHNRLYWNGGDWVGLGASAHSSIAGQRSENPRSIAEWREAIESGRLALRPEQPPTGRSLLGEAVMLGLRQSHGVSLAGLAERFGPGAAQEAESLFEPLVEGGFVRKEGSRRVLTERGLLVADSIMTRFF